MWDDWRKGSPFRRGFWTGFFIAIIGTMAIDAILYFTGVTS